jgi:hypothetical protein
MSRNLLASLTAASLVITGCASIPNGPSIMVLPGAGMSFDQFRYDDATCQQFATAQIGGTSASDSSVESGVGSAAVGTVLGAAAGAALGGGARGAAIGAGTGLLAGGLMGTAAASSSRGATQQHYDAAYMQCMYAKGHQIPVAGQMAPAYPRQISNAPAMSVPPPPPGTQAPSNNIPPPPAGSPPPPPPGL